MEEGTCWSLEDADSTLWPQRGTPVTLFSLSLFSKGGLGEISDLHFNKLLRQFCDSVAQVGRITTTQVQAFLWVGRWRLIPCLCGSLNWKSEGQNPSARFQYLWSFAMPLFWVVVSLFVKLGDLWLSTMVAGCNHQGGFEKMAQPGFLEVRISVGGAWASINCFF